MRLFVLLIPFLLLFSAWITERSVGSEIHNISRQYNTISTLEVKVNYNAYSFSESKIPIQTMKGVIYQTKDYNYNSIGQITSLTTPDYILAVDNENSTIILSPKEENPNMAWKRVGQNLGKIEEKCQSSGLEKINDTTNVITLIKPGFGFEKLLIQYNSNSYLIEQIRFFYGEGSSITNDPSQKPRLDIVYSDYKINKKLPEGIFEIRKYLKKDKNGDYQPSGEYARYRFYNQLKMYKALTNQ